MDDADLTITIDSDRPPSGMWHCGPNACWVTVKHNPTQIMARAFHRQQRKAREIALACVELMVAECGTDTPQFPEATK